MAVNQSARMLSHVAAVMASLNQPKARPKYCIASAAVFRPKDVTVSGVFKLDYAIRHGFSFDLRYSEIIDISDPNNHDYTYVFEFSGDDGEFVCLGWRGWYWYVEWHPRSPFFGFISFILRSLLCRFTPKSLAKIVHSFGEG